MDIVKQASDMVAEMFRKLQQDYRAQEVLMKSVRELATQYRPVSMEVMEFACEMKEFAKESKDQHFGYLLEAINDEDIGTATVLLDNAATHFAKVLKKFGALKEKYENLAQRV